MEDIKKIDGSNSVRFVNAQHAHFHSRAYEMVNEFGFAKVNVNAELATEYKSNIDAEIELNNEARAYIETPQLAAGGCNNSLDKRSNPSPLMYRAALPVPHLPQLKLTRGCALKQLWIAQ